MSNPLSIAPASAEAPAADGRQPPRRDARRTPAPTPDPDDQSSDDAGQRLLIQEDGDTGDLVYVVVDRASGQVLAKVSREAVAQMRRKPDYAAGALIKARA